MPDVGVLPIKRKLGCEGIVPKRLGSLYRSGRSRHWIKIKNPAAPAVKRTPRGTGREYPVNAMINGGATWIDYILTAVALAAAVYALWVYKNIER